MTIIGTILGIIFTLLCIAVIIISILKDYIWGLIEIKKVGKNKWKQKRK